MEVGAVLLALTVFSYGLVKLAGFIAGPGGRNWTIWAQTAKTLGYRLDTSQVHGVLVGQEAEFGVRITVDIPKGTSDRSVAPVGRVQIEIDSYGAIPRELKLSAESALSARPDVQVGDPGFDPRIRIEGAEIWNTALLDSETRALLSEAADASKARVKDGKVFLEASGSIDDLFVIRRLRDQGVALAQRLSTRGRRVWQALQHIATHDPLASVQIRALQVLAEWFPSKETTLNTARLLLTHPEPRLQLLAALLLSEEGLEVLDQLVASKNLPNEIRASALQGALNLLSRSPQRERLLKGLTDPQSALQEVALKALQAMAPGDDLLPVENALLALLPTASTSLQPHVILALAKHGYRRSVEALLPLTQGGLRSGRTQQLAKDAIEEIQARFVQADAGQLSLIDSSPREGALSLEAERGGLALTPTSSETLD